MNKICLYKDLHESSRPPGVKTNLSSPDQLIRNSITESLSLDINKHRKVYN